MEAATPLRHPRVHVAAEQLLIDGLVVDDECAVRLVREREEAGEDTERAVVDAIEIGARVLDREQAGAQAEAVRLELEKAVAETKHELTEHSSTVVRQVADSVDAALSPESGTFTKLIERYLSADSSEAVQNQVKQLVGELNANARTEIVKLFGSTDGPLAHVHERLVEGVRTQEKVVERVAALEVHLEGLREEKRKQEELAGERERGTAKGRTFEEHVHDAVDAIAAGQGDTAEAVGDKKEGTGKKGDTVVEVGACSGPALGRIVFEAKNKKMSRPEAIRELDAELEQRSADFAVLVVPAEEKVPAKLMPLREFGGDKLVIAWSPEDGSTLALEVGYRLARARVLMARSEAAELDADAVRDRVQRALNAMEDVRKVKQQLTGATTSIGKAEEYVNELAGRVRTYLAEIEALASSDGA